MNNAKTHGAMHTEPVPLNDLWTIETPFTERAATVRDWRDMDGADILARIVLWNPVINGKRYVEIEVYLVKDGEGSRWKMGEWQSATPAAMKKILAWLEGLGPEFDKYRAPLPPEHAAQMRARYIRTRVRRRLRDLVELDHLTEDELENGLRHALDIKASGMGFVDQWEALNH